MTLAKNCGSGLLTPQPWDVAIRSTGRSMARSRPSALAGWFPAMPTHRPWSRRAARLARASGYRSASVNSSTSPASARRRRSVTRSKSGLKYRSASRNSRPVATIPPNTAENVCRGMPSQSAHWPCWRVSSTSVSPTSKTTASITRAVYGRPRRAPPVGGAAPSSERYASTRGSVQLRRGQRDQDAAAGQPDGDRDPAPARRPADHADQLGQARTQEDQAHDEGELRRPRLEGTEPSAASHGRVTSSCAGHTYLVHGAAPRMVRPPERG